MDEINYIGVISDEHIEKSVLGSILSYQKAFNEVADILSDKCFSSQFHKSIYSAILAISERGDEITITSVYSELNKSGNSDQSMPFLLTQIAGSCSGSYYQDALILNEFQSRNKAYLIGQKLIVNAKDLTIDIYDSVEASNKDLSDVFSIPSNDISTMEDAALSLYNDHIKKNLSSGNSMTGSPTGFSEFDKKSGGLQKGDLIIVAGETSQGKTSLAMAMAMSAAKSGDPIAFYSLEMTTTQLFARMASCETGIPANTYLYGRLNQGELSEFDSCIKRMVEMPVYFDDKSTSNIDVIISSIRVMVAKKRIKGVIVDYLQILNVNMKGSNKEQQMGEVARRLKNLAKDLGIWIIALSQLRRDDQNHVPNLNRLRDSGQIAEASDIVILLYRPEIYGQNYPEPFKNSSTNGTAMIDVAKGRNIGLLKFIVGFEANTTRFYELGTIPGIPYSDDNPF